MLETVIYLGPTLPLAEAKSLVEATFLPPIRRGDLLELPETVRTVGIIDGEFYQSLAVSPKEVLVLLERGVQVFGASSMGALRAAETEPFGAVGVGRIFAMFRDGVLDGDDEVALVYDPQTYAHLSEPLVNLRHTLALAVEQTKITAQECDRVLAELKRRYFPDRSYQALEQLCPSLREFLRVERLPDVKREDAIELLLTIRAQQGLAVTR